MFCRPEFRVVMIGYYACGRTTALYQLKEGKFIENCVPTVGFNVEVVPFKKAALHIWDVGGGCKLREIWHHYYEGTHGIVFFIDASLEANKGVVDETVGWVRKALECTTPRCPFLILINKTDIATMTPA